ncbi:GTP-binding protein [Chroococcus sp. FPU101]|uniref:CobW family GTP-binding protein n=1 Tax=Chroococcus sp. FPU101 TaxID=1974212 RepID=UPI001A8E73D8|nr:GTP-binding protein [Chroococcus sp. FPU101]GFE68504.1 cobalamin synthesis protein P47K [Chroococcus sp. FPU101]
MTNLPSIAKRGLPVTIITGFLGSGKTTLVNEILQNKQNLKVAVLVNEFGNINIDAQLLMSIDENMVELSNGCICCTINDGLVEAIYRILERKDQIDYVIIETTGIADPLPIILTFVGTKLQDLTYLDSIITVVDAEGFNTEHFHSEAALKQIRYADIILLNKTDLATPQKLSELENYLKKTKKEARILLCQYSQVPLPLLLDLQLTPIETYQLEALKEEKHHHHSDHLENDGFVAVSFQSNQPFDVYKFEKFIINEIPIEVFRGKGIIRFAGSKLRHIFQLSGTRYDLKSEAWKDAPNSQLVFIGRHLESEKIIQLLQECLVTEKI